MAEDIKLPSGFTLDNESQEVKPPSGFTLDESAQKKSPSVTTPVKNVASTDVSKPASEQPLESGAEVNEPIKLTDEERYGRGVVKADVLTPVSDEEKLLRDKLDKDKKEASAIEGSFGKKTDEIKEKEKTLNWKKNVADYLRRIVGDTPPQEGEPMVTEVADDPTPIDIYAPINLDRESYGIDERGFPKISENTDPELSKRVFMKNTREFAQAQKDFDQIEPVLKSIKTVGQAKRALGVVDGDLNMLTTELKDKQQKIDKDYKRVRELNANKLTEMGLYESFESGMEQTTKSNEVADLLIGGTDKELESTLEGMYSKNMLYGDRERSEVAEMIGGQVKPMGITFASAIATGNPIVAAGVGAGYYARLGAGSEAIQAYNEARAQGKTPSEALGIAKEQSKSGAVAGGIEGLAAATLPVSKALGSIKIASPLAKAIVKGAAEAGVDALAAAGAQTYNNYNANKNGLIRDLSDGVAEQATAEAVFGVGFQLLFHGAAKLSPKNYKQLVTSYSKYDFNTIQTVVDDAVKQGTLNYAQAQPILEDLRKSATAQSKLKGVDIPADKEVEVVEIQQQIDELEKAKETASPAILPAIEKKMEELNHELQVAAGIGLTAKEKLELNKLQTARDENKAYDKDKLKLLEKRQRSAEKKVDADEAAVADREKVSIEKEKPVGSFMQEEMDIIAPRPTDNDDSVKWRTEAVEKLKSDPIGYADAEIATIKARQESTMADTSYTEEENKQHVKYLQEQIDRYEGLKKEAMATKAETVAETKAEPNIFEKIEEAKRSKKSAKEKQNAAREAVKDMGEVGEKAIFVDENFNDIKQKLSDLIKQGTITNLKIEC